MLDSQPTEDVTVTPEVENVNDATISVSGAWTFTPRNGDAPRTVTVSASADDNAVHGSATITHTVVGGGYEANRVGAPTIAVVEVDRGADLEHSGDVTIAAQHPTALKGIDRLVFEVARSVAADYDLEVPVTLSPGIIDAARLSRTVTIRANRASAELRMHTRTLDDAAATGDVTGQPDHICDILDDLHAP